MRRLVNTLHARSRSIEGRSGVSGPELWALRELLEVGDGGLTIGRLAERLALHKANASRVVDRLEERGLAVRRPDDDDRRVVVVRPTRAGRDVVRRGPRPAQADLLTSLEALPARELAAIERALGRLVSLLGAAEPDAPLFFDGGAPGPPRRRKPAS